MNLIYKSVSKLDHKISKLCTLMDKMDQTGHIIVRSL